MKAVDTAIGVFADHKAAEEAVRALAAGGFPVQSLTIVGKGYHTEEHPAGFYNATDRVKLWGTRGAFWGAIWGLFVGGVLMTAPVAGPVVVFGYLATLVVSSLETAAVVGGASALAGALASIGVPKNSILRYEAAIKADNFLVMAHGSALDVARAKAILDPSAPLDVERYSGMGVALPETD